MLGDLPPSSSVTRLSALPALPPISRPDDRRAGEGDLVDARVVDERRAGIAVARDHVEDALRQPGLERQLAEPQGGQRGLLGRLQDDRAAGRERRADLPGRHQQREVPGDDLTGDAHRLLARVAVHPVLGDGQHLAGDVRRPAGEVADVLGGELHVDALGELHRLAVVERLELGELVRVRVDRVGEREHRARARGGGDPGPAAVLERLAGGAHGAVDVLRARVGHGGDQRVRSRDRACRSVRPSAASSRSPPITRRCGPAAKARAGSERASGSA